MARVAGGGDAPVASVIAAILVSHKLIGRPARRLVAVTDAAMWAASLSNGTTWPLMSVSRKRSKSTDNVVCRRPASSNSIPDLISSTVIAVIQAFPSAWPSSRATPFESGVSRCGNPRKIGCGSMRSSRLRKVLEFPKNRPWRRAIIGRPKTGKIHYDIMGCPMFNGTFIPLV